MIETVNVDIPYTVDNGEKLVNETFGPNNIRRRKTGTHELKRVAVRNGRLLADRLSLDEQGFVLVEHKTKVADFFNLAQLESVLSAHNDYTEWSGPKRVREILPDEAEALLAHRFAIIQVWRAINQPIQANPLAIADGKSIDMEDLIVAERRYPHRVGQTYRLKYSPKHRWFYFPEMRRDEALVFKVYDSEKDGRARFTPHTSFQDPTSPPNAPPRQSIEVRALAFFAS